MPYERCMGLQVDDPQGYAQYREHMLPILARHQGRFRYDFEVAATLASESPAPINRVFVIAFPGQAENDAFFADADYQAVRERHFGPSVSAVTRLMETRS